MKKSIRLSRREFLSKVGSSGLGVLGLPMILPTGTFGAGGVLPPSERVALGCIGVGDRGSDVMGHFLNQSNCRVVAVCDVKQDRLAKAKATVDKQYQNADCRMYDDFRQLVESKDIDAVLIASTDHWHVLHALAAVRAGKDVYVEKPLGLSLAQDQVLRREVRARNRVFQFGTQQRSDRKFRVACELVRNGYIGQLKHINIWAPGSSAGGSTKEVPPPATINYESWLGPAPFRSHTESLTTNSVWWFVSDFALGFIAGWGIHPLDIALWGAGDLAGGEVTVQGQGHFPTAGVCNTATTWDVNFSFARGLTMRFVGAPNGSPGESFTQQDEWKQRYREIDNHGTAFEGTEGWVHVDRSRLTIQPESLIEVKPESFKEKLAYSPDHVQNFLQSVKSRKATVSPIDSAVRADAFCHVADIAIRRGTKLVYDVERERFKDNEEANRRLLRVTMRPPWEL